MLIHAMQRSEKKNKGPDPNMNFPIIVITQMKDVIELPSCT